MMIGYGSPFFIMMAMHDIGKMRRATLLCYTPFAVISVVLAVADAMSVISTGAPFLSDMASLAIIGILSIIEALVVLPLPTWSTTSTATSSPTQHRA